MQLLFMIAAPLLDAGRTPQRCLDQPKSRSASIEQTACRDSCVVPQVMQCTSEAEAGLLQEDNCGDRTT